MNQTIKIPDIARFCSSFGALGLTVGPRTGANKRTQDDKEWFVVRRILKEGLRARLFETPLSVRKGNPPEPDFVLELGHGNAPASLEITEATDPRDQREMTKFELTKNSAMLLGSFGGRFSGGVSQPGQAWASDVLDAIMRKGGKAICSSSDPNRHLVIYPNSNASSLLFNDEDELGAFSYLEQAIAMKRKTYVQVANGCLVHVLGKEYVCFDLFGKTQLVRREVHSN